MDYEFTDRQIIVYIDPPPAEEPVSFAYHPSADYPLNATVPSSSAGPYHDGDDKSETGEMDFDVE